MGATVHRPGEGELHAAGAASIVIKATTPSGYEHYMRDLARAAQDGPLTPQRIGAVAANYDIEIV